MEEKKKGKGLVVALVLFILVSIGLGGYIAYDKVLNKEEVKTKTEEKKKNKNVEVKKEEVNVKFDSDKSLNTKDIDYKMYETVEPLQVSVEEKNKVSIYIDKNKIYESFGIQDNANIKDSYDLNFDKEVVDVFIGGIGQDSSGTIIFFLLEDKTVQYIEVHKALQENSFTPKKADGVEEVIKFKNVSSRSKGAQTGGISNVLAVKSDGSFYDMEKVIFNR